MAASRVLCNLLRMLREKELTELAVNKQKFLINCMKSSPSHKIKIRTTTFVLLRVIKNCKQPNFKCVFFIDDLICTTSYRFQSLHILQGWWHTGEKVRVCLQCVFHTKPLTLGNFWGNDCSPLRTCNMPDISKCRIWMIWRVFFYSLNI